MENRKLETQNKISSVSHIQYLTENQLNTLAPYGTGGRLLLTANF